MLKLLRNLRRQEWAMAAVCAVLILGQINFDLALPDYMSSLTVLIKTPGSTLSDILHTGLEMLGCTLASAVLCVICGYLTAKVAAGFSFSIREAVFHKIADFGQQEMMTFSVPSLINRTTNDITQVQMLTAMGLQILIKSPVMAVWGHHQNRGQELDPLRYHRRICGRPAGDDGGHHRRGGAPVPPGAKAHRPYQPGGPGELERYQCCPRLQR